MRKEVLIAVIIFLFLINVIFVASQDKVDKIVEEKLMSKDKVKVIVVLKDSGIKSISKRGVSVKQLNVKERVLGNLDKNEFEKKHEFTIINGFSGEVTQEGLEKLKLDENVEKIYYDYPVKAFLQDSVPLINASVVHDLSYGNGNITGKDQTVCIIDTGINYTHPDLGGCNETSDINDGNCSKVIGGYDFVNNDTNPLDDQGHGTHVAGIVAANGGIIGVAPDAKLIAIKSLDYSGSGLASDIILGIEWCVNNASMFNISVISMSLGDESEHNSYCNDDAMTPYINSAVGSGIVVSVASGNCGWVGANCSNGISAPACIENATAVGAVDKSDSINYQRGNILNLLAPGLSINSTNISGDYVEKYGTSMATPHVAGAVALLKQYANLELNRTLDNDEIKTILNNTGVGIYDNESDRTYSRIDVYEAIKDLDDDPILILVSPENKTYTYNESLELNYTSEDNDLDSTWYNLDNNENIILNGNITFNVSGGAHTLFIFNNDSFGKENSTQVSFYVNLYTPIVTLNSPVNCYNSTTGDVTLNCSVQDGDANLANITFYHNLSGNFIANETVTIIGGENSSELILSNIPDNTNFIWNCEAYDESENVAFALENYTVNIKINDPPVIDSSTPSTLTPEVNEGSSMTFSVSASDPDNDVLSYSWAKQGNSVGGNSNSYTYSPGYDDAGNYTIKIIVNDGSLNVDKEWNLTVNDVNQSSSSTGNSGSSSGGGAATTTTETESVLIFSGLANDIKSFGISKDVGIEGVSITLNNAVTNAKLTVKKLDSNPTSSSLDNVYNYIQIDTSGLTNEDIKEAYIKFKVDKSWINTNAAGVNYVYMQRYNNGKWEKLETLTAGADDNYQKYQANTPGFSYFAINAEKLSNIITTNAVKEEINKEEAVATSVNNITNKSKFSFKNLFSGSVIKNLTDKISFKNIISKKTIYNIIFVVIIFLMLAGVTYKYREVILKKVRRKGKNKIRFKHKDYGIKKTFFIFGEHAKEVEKKEVGAIVSRIKKLEEVKNDKLNEMRTSRLVKLKEREEERIVKLKLRQEEDAIKSKTREEEKILKLKQEENEKAIKLRKQEEERVAKETAKKAKEEKYEIKERDDKNEFDIDSDWDEGD